MNYADFKASLDEDQPPTQINLLLQAMWWDFNDNWERAHALAQNDASSDGSWVHAYLHRKEGDEFNAGYWYSRAGRSKSKLSLSDEWSEIVRALLAE